MHVGCGTGLVGAVSPGATAPARGLPYSGAIESEKLFHLRGGEMYAYRGVTITTSSRS